MASPPSIEYTQALLDIANKLINGQGDGRISIKDIDEIFNYIIKQTVISKNDKLTLKYIANNYNLTLQKNILQKNIKVLVAIIIVLLTK